MKNFIQNGDVLTVEAPAGGVKSGDLVTVGAIVGVAAIDGAAGEAVELAVVGVFDLAKKTAADVLAVGDKVFASGAQIAKTGTGGAVGVVTEASAAGHATVRVRLNGVGV